MSTRSPAAELVGVASAASTGEPTSDCLASPTGLRCYDSARNVIDVYRYDPAAVEAGKKYAELPGFRVDQPESIHRAFAAGYARLVGKTEFAGRRVSELQLAIPFIGVTETARRAEPSRVEGVAERVLTQRELNRALLARQLLLERAQIPIPRALERIGGIQDQYAPNAYIRLWSCLEGFRRDDLTRALERRTVVQSTLLRATIHVVSTRDFWPFAVAIRARQRDWWLRVRKPRPDERELVRQADELRALMADGPRRHEELVEVVGRGWGMVGPWLELVRVPPSGTWEHRRAHLFQTAETWIGGEDTRVDDALDTLVKRYLGGFGPAPPKDIASWAGLKVGDIAPALERLSLRRFVDERGKELLDLPRAALPDPGTPAPVRFLPTWDAVLLVHARRTGVLPEKLRPLVFSPRNPPSVPTFLVDGAVAGTWRYEGGKVTLKPFERLERSVARELRDEAERLAAFHT